MASVLRRVISVSVALIAVGTAVTYGPVSAESATESRGQVGRGNPSPLGGGLADGPCWANEVRYVDCGNGTVTDQVTGLIWLQRSNCLGGSNFADANRAAQRLRHGGCSLKDRSKPGEWRLPTRAEWEATLLMPAAPCSFPALTNDAGSACWGIGLSSLLNVAANAYWSSSAKYSVELPNSVDRMRLAWKANLGVAGLEPTLATDIYLVWPVRRTP